MFRRKKSRAMVIPLTMDYFQDAFSIVKHTMEDDRISNEIISETMLLFEALYHHLVEQCGGRDIMLMVKAQRTFGEIVIKLGYEGKAYVPVERDQDDISPEIRIMQAYRDKVDYRYSSGYNSIRIVVKRSYSSSMIRCYIGILLAFLVYLPLQAYVSADSLRAIEARFVSPLITMFANAMLMVGAPVTLFSLIRNLTDIYILSERHSTGRTLQAKTFITSIISIVLAFGVSMIIAVLMNVHAGYLHGFGGSVSLSELITTLVPSSIIDPFETYLPFPMIIVALLITYAFCSAGEYFDTLRKGVDICYTLFSKMLHVVMFALPFFSFLAILTPLLAGSSRDLFVILITSALIVVSLGVIAAFYLIRLVLGGVKVGPFLKTLIPLVRENIKINSVIDAVPYNTRYCVRNYGYDRKRLSQQLPILAQTNLDGNCYLIMLIAMMLMLYLGSEATWIHILVIAVIVLFLSLGAPNQPGSILIGLLIILFYLHASDLICVAIYLEVLFGSIQNIINVVGDIVTVAIEDRRFKAAS